MIFGHVKHSEPKHRCFRGRPLVLVGRDDDSTLRASAVTRPTGPRIFQAGPPWSHNLWAFQVDRREKLERRQKLSVNGQGIGRGRRPCARLGWWRHASGPAPAGQGTPRDHQGAISSVAESESPHTTWLDYQGRKYVAFQRVAFQGGIHWVR